MAARNYSNIAVDTTLASGITDVATSMVVASATGWPSAPFVAVIEPGTADEELVLVGAKTGTTFSSMTRGYGGTSNVAHSAADEVKHVLIAEDAAHVYTHDHSGDYAQLDHGGLAGLGDDDHSQYHNASRADTWFATKSLASLATKDHDLLGGLADDDHTQYHTDARAQTWAEGKMSSWTPTLKADTTNPTLGSGSSTKGWYVQLGDLVIAWANIVFGTGGTAGNGNYYLTPPVTPHADVVAANNRAVHGVGRTVITSVHDDRITGLITSTTTLRLMKSSGSSVGYLDYGTPGAGDVYQGMWIYRAA